MGTEVEAESISPAAPSAATVPRHLVFISHASKDAAVAEMVCGQLESGGIKCWLAPRDVMAGRPYSGQITEAIRSAQMFLLILSQESNRSKQVLREVERAAHCQIRLLTFRIEKLEPNDDLAYFLGIDHWLDAIPGPPETYLGALQRQTLALLQAGAESTPEEVQTESTEAFAHFRILRRPDGSLFRLGKGGMGVTWKAIDLHLDRPVALKVISSDLLGSVAARQRFLREAQAAAKIHNSHVATVYHFGQEGDSYFYAMEFVEGEDLERYVASRGPLQPAVALRVVSQVAEALGAAQVHRLVHRDIKPANLMAMASPDGNIDIKLIDFGLAKGAASQDSDAGKITRSQDFVGSPAFASPEQCEMGDLDVRSDIYSLGVTLWYLLSGKRPFSGTVGQVMIAHAVKPPPFDQLTGIPEPVMVLLQRMLAKSPAERPQTPQQLQAEVQTAAARLAAEFGGISSRPVQAPAPAELPAAAPGPDSELLPKIDSARFDPYLKIEVGNLISGRYRLVEEEREGTGGRLFLAHDQNGGQSGQVALKLMHPGVSGDPTVLDLLENELGVINKAPHAQLIRYYRLERDQEAPFIVREWVHGFLLYDLLRWRGVLTAGELESLLGSFAAVLDFVSQNGFGLVEVSARKIMVSCPPDLHPDQFIELGRKDIRKWSGCSLKLNPLSLAPLLYRHRVNRPQQTLVPTSQVLSLTQAEAGIQGIKSVRLFGRLIYELLGGQSSTRLTDRPQYPPLAELNEPGNATLRRACMVTSEAVAYKTCADFWAALRPDLASRMTTQSRPAATPPREVTPPPLPTNAPKPPATPVKPAIVPGQKPESVQPKLVPPPVVLPATKPRRLALWLTLIAIAFVISVFIVGQAIYSAWHSQFPVAVVTPTPTPPIVTPTPTASPEPTTNDDASTYFARANKELDSGNLQAAISDYSRAIELKPEYAEAYNHRGWAYYSQHQYDKAIADYDKAIQIDPNFVWAYSRRGMTYYELQQFQRAVADYNQAINLSPNYSEAYVNRGNAYDELHQYDDALKDYSKAIELRSDYALAYYDRALLYRHLKQYDNAINDATKAIELKPDADSYLVRGNAYDDQKQYDKAIADYSKAIELQPDYAMAYSNRGNAYNDQGQYSKAISDYDKAIQLKPNYPLALNNRGNAYYNLKQYDRAVTEYTNAIRLDPNYAAAYRNRGDAYEKLGNSEKAGQDRAKAQELESSQSTPSSTAGTQPSALLAKGRKEAESGKYADAVADYTEAIRIDPDYSDAYVLRGEAHYYLSQYDQAVSDYSVGIRLRPNDAEIYNRRGVARELLKQYDQAISDYTAALRLKPDFALAYKNRGNIHDDLSQYSDAVNDYTQAIRLQPNYGEAYNLRADDYEKLGQSSKAQRDRAKAKELQAKQ